MFDTVYQRLDVWLRAVSARPFDWAAWNCGHFAADWVLAATGHRLALGLPATADPRAWSRALAQAGGLRAHVKAHTGAVALPGCLAQVGDVVLLPGRVVPEALAVCVGERIACVGHPGGVVQRPLFEARWCWRLSDLVASMEVPA